MIALLLMVDILVACSIPLLTLASCRIVFLAKIMAISTIILSVHSLSDGKQGHVAQFYVKNHSDIKEPLMFEQ